ncbi:MAG: hypothetical protein JXR48_06980 [Candidatus Delongbacteria bacterium]|nr:hypothetical protein [Candidatus Delongbacteria bacterium]
MSKVYEKIKLKKKNSVREKMEYVEFKAIVNKFIFEVKDFENNLLLKIYPAYAQVFTIEEDGVLNFDIKSSKTIILSKEFKKEYSDLKQELSCDFNFVYNIPIDINRKIIKVESAEIFHSLDFINYLEEGFWVFQPSEYSKENNIKFYIVDIEDDKEDVEINFYSTVLISNIDGVNYSQTMSVNSIIREKNLSHHLDKK